MFITAKNKTYLYNAAVQGPQGATFTSDMEDEAEWTPLEGADTLASLTIAGGKTDVGTYKDELVPSAAVVKNGETDVSENYEMTYVAGDLTINMVYFTVRFVDWNDTILKQVRVPYGGSTTAPVVTSDRPNYVFVGWDKPASTWEKNVTRDITIYAEYEMLEQAVTEITELGIPLAGGTVTNVGDSFD